MPPPSVELTGRTGVAVAVLIGAGVSWVTLSGAEAFGWPVPPVPWLAAAVVGVLALATWLAARWMRRAITPGRRRVEPAQAVALLLAGKAALLGGALLGAAYAVVALRYLPNLDAALPRERVLSAAVSTLLSGALALAGRKLERACQVPRPPTAESGDAPTDDPPKADDGG